MSEYTAEDFAQATFARHENGRKAVRFEGGVNASVPSPPWQVGRFGVATDDAMAAEGGWVPVVEDAAHDRIMTLLNTKKTHELAIEDLRHDLALALEELVDLRQENDRLERIIQAPLSMRDLRVAWEAAEEADECRKGDVLIERYPNRSWHVYRAESMLSVCRDVRILSRAPREPWQDLADVLRAWDEEPMDADLMGRARWMHERGVRVTGGDEK